MLVLIAVAIGAPSTVWAQVAGVSVDAEGVLRTKVLVDPGGQLINERVSAAKATLDPKVAKYSGLRKISLNRLEQAVIDHEGTLSDEMRYLAGLQRVRYVFYYPDSHDIVLAGPAEGWVSDVAGRVVGLTSRRPVVQLQDVVAALRMFPASGKPTGLIGCSIDPTQEGLAAMQQFARTIHLVSKPNDNEIQFIAQGMRNSLGLQTVTINGVSPKTHFAQVLVEADYRMKLIGIGLETPPVRLISYVERAKLSGGSRNDLKRWYFVPDYQCVRQSEDKLAMELVGDGVKLVGEDEVVLKTGERRTAAGRGDKASKAFVTAFTKRYPQLAERSPVYAELRNLIDLAVAAAYIQQQDYCGKAGWKMELFGSEKAFPIETYSVPKTVESAVNAIWQGNAAGGTLGTPIGGGVTIQATRALESDNLLSDAKDKVNKLHESIKPTLAKGQWWWD